MHIKPQLPGFFCTQQGRSCNCSILMQVINLHLPSGCWKLLQSPLSGQNLGISLGYFSLSSNYQPSTAWMGFSPCQRSLPKPWRRHESFEVRRQLGLKGLQVWLSCSNGDRGSLLNRVLSEGKCGITARLQQHPELPLQDMLHLLLHSLELCIPEKIKAIPEPLEANIPSDSHTSATAGHPQLLLSGNIRKSSCECAQSRVCAFTSACPLRSLRAGAVPAPCRDSQGWGAEAAAQRELQERLQSAAQGSPAICGVIPSQLPARHPQVVFRDGSEILSSEVLPLMQGGRECPA